MWIEDILNGFEVNFISDGVDKQRWMEEEDECICWGF